jgi:hypothetical protein
MDNNYPQLSFRQQEKLLREQDEKNLSKIYSQYSTYLSCPIPSKFPHTLTPTRVPDNETINCNHCNQTQKARSICFSCKAHDQDICEKCGIDIATELTNNKKDITSTTATTTTTSPIIPTTTTSSPKKRGRPRKNPEEHLGVNNISTTNDEIHDKDNHHQSNHKKQHMLPSSPTSTTTNTITSPDKNNNNNSEINFSAMSMRQQEIYLREEAERAVIHEYERIAPTTTLKTCPQKGHPLKPIRIPNRALLCDACGNIQKELAITLSCQQCDWDCCLDCASKPLTTTIQQPIVSSNHHHIDSTTTVRIPLSTRQQEKLLQQMEEVVSSTTTTTISSPSKKRKRRSSNITPSSTPISKKLITTTTTNHTTSPSIVNHRNHRITTNYPQIGDMIEVEWQGSFFPSHVVNIFSPISLIEIEYDTHEFEVIDLTIIEWHYPANKFIPPELTTMDFDRASALSLLPSPNSLEQTTTSTTSTTNNTVTSVTTTTIPSSSSSSIEEFPINSLVRVAKREGVGIKGIEGGVGRVLAFDPIRNVYKVRMIIGREKVYVGRHELEHENIATFGVGTIDKRPERCLLDSSSTITSTTIVSALSSSTSTEESLIAVASSSNSTTNILIPSSPSPQPIPNTATTTTTTTTNPTTTTTTDDYWVRRSVRHAGTDQLERAGVKDLITRLERDDPKLKILRLKNWLEADTNALVLDHIFDLLAKSKSIQVLYCQNLEKAMDDDRLYHLIQVLKQNSRIWALNVGENFKITRRGWDSFAEALKDTSITHLYAGSESTVSGTLKVKMRDAARENRKKHNLHDSRDNLDTILAVGQMWWNPRNSTKVRGFIKNMVETLDEGTFIALKLGTDTGGNSSPITTITTTTTNQHWQTARVIKGPCSVLGAPPRLFLLYFEETNELRWIDLDESRLSCTTTSQIVWGKTSTGQWWPAVFFPEPEVLAFVFGLPLSHVDMMMEQVRNNIQVLVGDRVIFKSWEEGMTIISDRTTNTTTSSSSSSSSSSSNALPLGLNVNDPFFLETRNRVEMELRRIRQRDE